MSKEPKEDPETLFIREEETPEQKERKRKLLDKLKEKTGMASNFPSEEETMPGVEEDHAINAITGMGFTPIDDDFDDDFDENLFINKPVVKQVVYGFYGLGPNDFLQDTWFQMTPNGVFRANYVLAFPVDDNNTIITNIKCGNTEQLITEDGVHASAFKCEYPLDLLIDRYFDGKSTEPNGIIHLLGDELDGRGLGSFYLEFDTISPPTGMTISFKGKLRALLIIGTEPINPS